MSILQALDKPCFDLRGSEEGEGRGGADHAVEVDAGPDEEGGGEAEDHEGRGGEAEC